ncbi:hypothetical protein ABIB73_004842 [Bradyrhizobium sp. F1.4.3]|uniref:hypothetical protein n=1 Tax=Bradyrhizobium sp. F1.4.3 TaxID=3156356 RepID=UPI003394B2B3
MAATPPTKEFGKRRPAPVSPAPREPVKRSGHVALLVMGTIAVGTTAYTLIPRQNCDPPPPGASVLGAVAPAQTSTPCSSGSSGSSSHWSSRSSFFSSDSSSHSSSGTSSDSGSGGVTRGGFGSFAHGISGGG